MKKQVSKTIAGVKINYTATKIGNSHFVLTIPQSMTGEQLSKWKAENADAIQQAKSEMLPADSEEGDTLSR